MAWAKAAPSMNPQPVAFCTPYADFSGNRIFDESYATSFPGARAMALLAAALARQGREIVTGDVAAARIRNGELDPRHIVLIQEADADDGLWLLEQGADPRVLVCLESPGYAWKFYDMLPGLAPRFATRILFRGAFDSFQATGGENIVARFPSFPRAPAPFDETPWADRRFIVAVAANKSFLPSPVTFSPRGAARLVRRCLMGGAERRSPTLRSARKCELATARLQAFAHFGRNPDFALFGPGWSNLSRMPQPVRDVLKGQFAARHPQPCGDKTRVLSQFKFALCYENCRFPGYVTEKIFDGLAAGSIPVYFGAPDIADFCPPDCYVHAPCFPDLAAMEIHLRGLTPERARSMIAAGRNFLASPAGQCHSHEALADTLLRRLQAR